jgi:hypothetical protein
LAFLIYLYIIFVLQLESTTASEENGGGEREKRKRTTQSIMTLDAVPT